MTRDELLAVHSRPTALQLQTGSSMGNLSASIREVLWLNNNELEVVYQVDRDPHRVGAWLLKHKGVAVIAFHDSADRVIPQQETLEFDIPTDFIYWGRHSFQTNLKVQCPTAAQTLSVQFDRSGLETKPATIPKKSAGK
jgi:hypothetical protein